MEFPIANLTFIVPASSNRICGRAMPNPRCHRVQYAVACFFSQKQQTRASAHAIRPMQTQEKHFTVAATRYHLMPLDAADMSCLDYSPGPCRVLFRHPISRDNSASDVAAFL
jgi:hypothetical protein